MPTRIDCGIEFFTKHIAFRAQCMKCGKIADIIYCHTAGIFGEQQVKFRLVVNLVIRYEFTKVLPANYS